MCMLHAAARSLPGLAVANMTTGRHTAGNVERLHETTVRQTVQACAILSTLPQSTISIVLQVRRALD